MYRRSFAASFADGVARPSRGIGFPFQVRAAASDRLAANLKAEHALAGSRGPTWAYLVSPCGAHCVAGTHTKKCKLMPYVISGMAHVSLSLRAPGVFKRDRLCIAGITARHILAIHGSPGADADAFAGLCSAMDHGSWM